MPYSYDRRVANEQLVVDPVSFPSSKGDKQYHLPPGTPMEQSGHMSDGTPFWVIPGWHAPQPIPEEYLKGKVIDLHDFFQAVARKGRGVFIPPQWRKWFIVALPDRDVRVFFEKGGPIAEVEYSIGDEKDYTVSLSVDDFKSPDRFLKAVL